MTQCIARSIRGAVYAIVVLVVLSRGVAHANAAFMFGFEGDFDKWTTFTTTNNSVSATISSPGEQFTVSSTSSMFLNLSGNALFQVDPEDRSLSILFDQNVEYVQLAFGSTVPGQLTLTALAENLSLVGQATAASMFLSGNSQPEGTISFGGSAFRSLELSFTSSDDQAMFAIDDVTNMPEPGTLFLLGLGAIMLGCAQKRLRVRQ